MKRTALQWVDYLENLDADDWTFCRLTNQDANHLAALLRAMVAEREAYEALLHYAPNSAENIEPATAARRRAEGRHD